MPQRNSCKSMRNGYMTEVDYKSWMINYRDYSINGVKVIHVRKYIIR